MDHRIVQHLLSTLFGVTHGVHGRFNSYISRRTQVIRTDMGKSGTVALTCGVIQDLDVVRQQFNAYIEDVEEPQEETPAS